MGLKKLYFLLTIKEKKSLYLLLLIMILGGIVEAFGIAIIYPFMSILNDASILKNYPFIIQFFEKINITEYNHIVIVFALLMILFFILKNTFITFMHYNQFSFTFTSQVNLAKRLYKKYLFNDYEFHINRNSSELLRNLRENSLWIFSHILYPILSIITETFVLFFILAVLFYVSPIITLALIFSFFILGYIFFSFVKKKARLFGSLQQHSLKSMNKWINQGLNGVKDIKLHGNESFFMRNFSDSADKYAHYNVYLKTVESLPRQFLETIIMISISLSAIFIILSEGTFLEVLPVITLFAFSAMRIMPSMNKILTSLTGIKFYTSSLEAIYADFVDGNLNIMANNTPINGNELISFKNRILLKNISYRYPGVLENNLDNISFSIEKGNFIGIVGSSGSGKSTLVDIITGILKANDGEIYIDSNVINNDNLHLWQDSIGYIPQFVYLMDDSIKNNIAFGQNDEDIDEDKILKVLDDVNLKDYIINLQDGINTFVGENGVRLSGGQKQRLGIARALYFDAEVLIFDETTSALDSVTEEQITQVIKKLSGNKTIIMIAHRLSTIKNANKIFFMEEGKVVSEGMFNELYKNNCQFKDMVDHLYK